MNLSNSSRTDHLKKLFAPALFLCFSALILGAILILQPGWGFMDDHTNLRISRNFWMNPSWNLLGQIIMSDTGVGRFRPLYIPWVVSVYKLCLNAPYLIYFFTTALGLLLLPLWGVILDKAFNHNRKSIFLIWAFPLAFFIFLPFWNNFMYISVQEKFLYLFFAPAIFFFLRAYEKERLTDLLPAFAWSALALAGKETGVILILAFGAYALTDLIVFRRSQKISLAAGVLSLAAFSGYYIFITGIMKGYTKKYTQNSNMDSVLLQLKDSPLFIKLILGLSALALIMTVVEKIRRPASRENGGTLFAWLAVIYVMILLPWGFPTYILPPLAIFLVGMATPLFLAADRHPWGNILARFAVIFLAFLSALLFIIPNIEKMADKRRVVEEIKAIAAQEPSAIFLYPPPYTETAHSLRTFTKATIVRLRRSSLDLSGLAGRPHVFLVMNDECYPMSLLHMAPAQTVYASSTWRILTLMPSPGTQPRFKPAFPRNALQKIKDLIKHL